MKKWDTHSVELKCPTLPLNVIQLTVQSSASSSPTEWATRVGSDMDRYSISKVNSASIVQLAYCVIGSLRSKHVSWMIRPREVITVRYHSSTRIGLIRTRLICSWTNKGECFGEATIAQNVALRLNVVRVLLKNC